MVRIGASGGRGLVLSTVLCTAVQTDVARSAFRAATGTSQYITSVEPNLLWASCL